MPIRFLTCSVVALVGLAACEADREAVEDTSLDAPAAVEQAPATPIPSEAMQDDPMPADSPTMPADTLPLSP